VRHARTEDLDSLALLLEQLRRVDGLTEKSSGTFYRGSKAFLHFHADGDDRYADVKIDGTFERFPATTTADQRAVVRLVRKLLSGLP
jgi:hypothetical protein